MLGFYVLEALLATIIAVVCLRFLVVEGIVKEVDHSVAPLQSNDALQVLVVVVEGNVSVLFERAFGEGGKPS